MPSTRSGCAHLSSLSKDISIRCAMLSPTVGKSTALEPSTLQLGVVPALQPLHTDNTLLPSRKPLCKQSGTTEFLCQQTRLLLGDTSHPNKALIAAERYPLQSFVTLGYRQSFFQTRSHHDCKTCRPGHIPWAWEAQGAQASSHHISGFQPNICKLHLTAPPKAAKRNRSSATGSLQLH